MQLSKNDGYTLLEITIVLAMLTILSLTAMYNLKSMSHPLNNAGFSVEHFLRFARSRAISGTEVIKVSVASSERMQAFTSDSCTGTMTAIPDLFLDLPLGASFTDTTANVCFTPRGFVIATGAFPLTDTEGRDKTIKVALGGGTKVD